MFEIKNVKISLKLEIISLKTVIEHLKVNAIEFQVKNNYIVINYKYSFVLFKPKNKQIRHVNVTKIPNLEEIDTAVDVFENKIFNNLGVHINKIIVDNLTAVYNTGKSIYLPDIIKNKKDHFIIKYNNEKFPGMFVKFDVGTLIIFHTGKIIAVGCKTLDQLKYLFDELIKLL